MFYEPHFYTRVYIRVVVHSLLYMSLVSYYLLAQFLAFSLLNPMSTRIMEEPANNGSIMITEYEGTDSPMQILNPKLSTHENSFMRSSPENSTSESNKLGTGQDMVVRRHDNDSGAETRRAIRKIKSQSHVETDI